MWKFLAVGKCVRNISLCLLSRHGENKSASSLRACPTENKVPVPTSLFLSPLAASNTPPPEAATNTTEIT